MWFVQIICAPFKAVVLLYKGIRLVIIGCKAAAPHVNEGLNKANAAMEEFNQTAQKWLDEQERATEDFKTSTRIERLKRAKELQKASGIELLEIPNEKSKE